MRARRVRPPRPPGDETVDHVEFRGVLESVARRGVEGLADVQGRLDAYREKLWQADPDRLGHSEALAYWLNLYNAEGLAIAAEARRTGTVSVFRLPGAFTSRRLSIAGESLSVDDVEHGKIRRFGDPRIHGALVCGAVSCPTLRAEPFVGRDVDRQLEDQMKTFLQAGAAVVQRETGMVALSRIFKWFGGDFTRPHRMPTLLPAPKRSIVDAITRWMSEPDAVYVRRHRPRVAYQPYDFSLGCRVG